MRLRRKLHRLTVSARALLLALLCLPLGGCLVASAVTAVVVLPVKLVGAGIDAAVTTDAEADQQRGRDAREAEEKAKKAADKAKKQQAKADKDAAKAAAKAAPAVADPTS